MKTQSNSLLNKLKFSLFIIFLLGGLNHSIAQKMYNVSVSNNIFTPANLTIDVNDTVKWTNIAGNHNVNGSISTYPSNPISFGNSVGAGWVYTFVFSKPGVYDYRCDPHVGSGMVGKITVIDNTGINQMKNLKNSVNIYPNPISDIAILDISSLETSPKEYIYLELFNSLGMNIKRNIQNDGMFIKVSVGDLPAGMYFFKLFYKKETLYSGKFIVE